MNVAIISTKHNSLNAASDSNDGEIAHLESDYLLRSETSNPDKIDFNDQNYKLGMAKGTLTTLDIIVKR